MTDYTELKERLRIVLIAQFSIIQGCKGLDHERMADAAISTLGDAITALEARVAELEGALRRIGRWHGEFPPTGKFWESGEPMSYGALYGSDGERDFMRETARTALGVQHD